MADRSEPFLFISDFHGESNYVIPVGEVDASQILYSINGFSNSRHPSGKKPDTSIQKKPIELIEYQALFSKVHRELTMGNTYLLNLTCQTPISLDCSLKDIYHSSSAHYKLCIEDQFVVFSPETFMQIKEGKISSFPMKGTIDAKIPDAEKKILNSSKEMAEHTTIVDLIRNDMSIHASDVRVEKFRYIDHVKTNQKDLLQVSSKITGKLPSGYQNQMGEIIFSLLPAGSICGAPKSKTLEIIEQVENYERGFYTGVVGYFDGRNFDSGVMIRFIQKEGDNFYYKSGGGVHFLSDPESEYQEMIDKVYVPVH